ncbi:hypothetical protein J4N45_10990 [Vibrio sp. SCSIO 43140]|uniref:hypothetical protein n=1 Tax=Vibrio sp. SCSIO 43140 TaxID=2819100 RepID=UPI00207513EC|nr:hypothetical protein [Vibrio sp. SCSIO 43140]USD59056.1 hypothetical protein J4N45_10990 [Vibrio sp. SCSIO 43140]
MIEVQKNITNDDTSRPSEHTTKQVESIQSVDVDSLNAEQSTRIFEYLMEQVSL